MYLLLKRFFDFLFSALGLVLISPLLLIIIIANHLTGEGEVFYLQDRMGLNNSKFGIIKFATMLKNSPNMKGGSITLRRDPRITPVGRWLRISKLNELPQLINVLKGDMSFVGPRPLMPISFEKYSPDVQAEIYKRKPGITGIGSVIFRDEEKLVTEARDRGEDPMDFYKRNIFPHKGAVELWYGEHQSFWTDFKILLLTALAIIAPNQNLTYSFFPSLPKRAF